MKILSHLNQNNAAGAAAGNQSSNAAAASLDQSNNAASEKQIDLRKTKKFIAHLFTYDKETKKIYCNIPCKGHDIHYALTSGISKGYVDYNNLERHLKSLHNESLSFSYQSATSPPAAASLPLDEVFDKNTTITFVKTSSLTLNIYDWCLANKKKLKEAKKSSSKIYIHFFFFIQIFYFLATILAEADAFYEQVVKPYIYIRERTKQATGQRKITDYKTRKYASMKSQLQAKQLLAAVENGISARVFDNRSFREWVKLLLVYNNNGNAKTASIDEIEEHIPPLQNSILFIVMLKSFAKMYLM